MVKIALFGPPGIGKSTLVKELGGYDLEENFPKIDVTRLQTANVLGAAGHQPTSNIFKGFKRILLVMDQRDYDQQRLQRDIKDEKRGGTKFLQERHLIKDWMISKDFDLELTVDKQTLSKLKEIMK